MCLNVRRLCLQPDNDVTVWGAGPPGLGQGRQQPELTGRGGLNPQSQAPSPTPPARRDGQLSNCLGNGKGFESFSKIVP